MEATRSFLRPLASASSTLAGAAARRHQSTTARTKKALKVAPHPSFANRPTEGPNQIIFNPPSSVASVYHTPFKFLPKSDPRRQASLTQLIRSSADLSTSAPTPSGNAAPPNLPPSLTPTEEQRNSPQYTVSKEQVEEMRELRHGDPATWSVIRLAQKFNCTKYFVMMCCKAPAKHKYSERARKKAIRDRWGPIRSNARLERQKRKTMILKGEIA